MFTYKVCTYMRTQKGKAIHVHTQICISVYMYIFIFIVICEYIYILCMGQIYIYVQLYVWIYLGTKTLLRTAGGRAVALEPPAKPMAESKLLSLQRQPVELEKTRQPRLLGSFNGSSRAPFKGFGADIRQL